MTFGKGAVISVICSYTKYGAVLIFGTSRPEHFTVDRNSQAIQVSNQSRFKIRSIRMAGTSPFCGSESIRSKSAKGSSTRRIQHFGAIFADREKKSSIYYLFHIHRHSPTSLSILILFFRSKSKFPVAWFFTLDTLQKRRMLPFIIINERRRSSAFGSAYREVSGYTPSCNGPKTLLPGRKFHLAIKTLSMISRCQKNAFRSFLPENAVYQANLPIYYPFQHRISFTPFPELTLLSMRETNTVFALFI